MLDARESVSLCKQKPLGEEVVFTLKPEGWGEGVKVGGGGGPGGSGWREELWMRKSLWEDLGGSYQKATQMAGCEA